MISTRPRLSDLPIFEPCIPVLCSDYIEVTWNRNINDCPFPYCLFNQDNICCVHCHVCLDSKIPVQFYFIILHDIIVCSYHLSELSSPCFLHNSQRTLLATLSCLLLYCFCGSLGQPLTRCMMVTSFVPHNLHLGEMVVCLSLLWLNCFLVPAPQLQITCPLARDEISSI